VILEASPRATLQKLDTAQAQKMWLKIYSYECGFYTNWLESCKDNRRFYYGIQSTDEEREVIANRGQYEININKIRKSMRGIVGHMAAAVPQYKLTPLSDNDFYTASIGERVIKWAWANSNGIHTMRAFVKNAAVDNVSYFYVYVDNKGMIKFKTLAFNEVIPDPTSTDPLYRDAEMLMIRREVSVSYVKKYYDIPDIELTKLQFEYSGSYYGGGVDDDNSYSTSFDGFLEKIASPDSEIVRIYEIFSKDPYTDNEGNKRDRIIKRTVLGFSHVYEEILDERISEYPIIPGYVDKAENPYPRGEVHFIKELQRFINKCYGVTLLNAQLMSNPKIFLRETDIPNNNMEEFQNNFSAPGSVSIITAGAEAPIVIQGQPLNAAFFTLYQDAKLEMEYNTIPNALLGMNDSEKAYQPSVMLDMKQTVMDSFKDFMSVIEMATSQLGLVVLQYSRAYLPENKILRIVGMEDIVMNQRQEIDVNDEQSVGKWIQYQRQRNVPDEAIEERLAEMKISDDKQKALIYFINEPDFESYDVTVVPGSYTPTYEMSMFRIMMELAQIGSVDPSVPLEYLPTENRKELVERFDTIKRLTQQVDQLEQKIKDTESIVKSQQRQLINSEVAIGTSENLAKIEKEATMSRIKSYLNKHQDRLNSKEARQNLENEIRKILNDVELEAEKQKVKMKETGYVPLRPFDSYED
jgi:hypothetical protein